MPVIAIRASFANRLDDARIAAGARKPPPHPDTGVVPPSPWSLPPPPSRNEGDPPLPPQPQVALGRPSVWLDPTNQEWFVFDDHRIMVRQVEDIAAMFIPKPPVRDYPVARGEDHFQKAVEAQGSNLPVRAWASIPATWRPKPTEPGP